MNEEMIIKHIAQAVADAGGRAYLVGGFVRDQILNQMGYFLEFKDRDVEVYGIPVEQFVSILEHYGQVDFVGASFGVWRMKHWDIDFSMPRKDQKTGKKHTDFEVYIDPYLSPKDAAKRRDFTCNALMQDCLTYEILDFFHGKEDLEQGILRHVDDSTFIEDPLRVLRAIQFAARFNLQIADDTAELCQKLAPEVDHLPRERRFEELIKLLTKAEEPSIGLQLMAEWDLLHPLLQNLIDCLQNPKYHAEGDAWNHTLLVVDEMARIDNSETMMLAALLHDIGKPKVSREMEGRIISHGHAEVGAPLAAEFLKTLTDEKHLIQEVCTLVKEHMNPYSLYRDKASNAALKRFSRRVDIHAVLNLAEADDKGSLGNEKTPMEDLHRWFADKIETLHLDKPIIPLVNGKTLIQMGLKPGPDFKRILHQAMELQLDGYSPEEIMTQIENICVS